MSAPKETMRVWIPGYCLAEKIYIQGGWAKIEEQMDGQLFLIAPCGERYTRNGLEYYVSRKNEGRPAYNVNAICIAEQLLCEGEL